MGFGILRVGERELETAYRERYGEAEPSESVDLLRDFLMIPAGFTVAHGPFRDAVRNELVWILASGVIPQTMGETRLTEVAPVYVRHSQPDTKPYTTLERIEFRAGDYSLLGTYVGGASSLPNTTALVG